MTHQERFSEACKVTDFEPHPSMLGGYKVWGVSDIVKGGRVQFDGPYFTEAEASIGAELWFQRTSEPSGPGQPGTVGLWEDDRRQRGNQLGDLRRRSAMNPIRGKRGRMISFLFEQIHSLGYGAQPITKQACQVFTFISHPLRVSAQRGDILLKELSRKS